MQYVSICNLSKLIWISCIAPLGFVADAYAQQQCPTETPVANTQRFVDNNGNGSRDPGEVQIPLPNNRIVPIRLASDTRNVLFHWDNLPTGPDTSPANGVPDLGDQFIAQVENYLQLLEAQGFRIPPGVTKCQLNNVFTVFLYQANTGGFNAGTARADSVDVHFSVNLLQAQQIPNEIYQVLLHELFHTVQFQYDFRTFSAEWDVEGIAKLSADIFDPALDDLDPQRNDSCLKQVLAQPELSMFARGPCQPVMFWRYFTEQIGTNQAEPSYGVDALLGWYEYMTTLTEVWRMQGTDKIRAIGDFDGDGREEFLLKSLTHLGLIASEDGNTRVLDVTNFESRLNGGWYLSAQDRILGSGDFNRNGRDEIMIRSNTHVGFLASDRDGPLTSITSVVNQEGTFGQGWRPSPTDKFIAIGDFDGDGADEAAISSSTHIGLVGLTRSNEPRTLHAQLLSGILTGDGIAGSSIFVTGVGDINGDGRDDIVGTDDAGMVVFSYLDDPKRFEIIARANFEQRIGGQWLLKSNDYFYPPADLNHAAVSGVRNRDEIVVRSDTHVGILGLNEDGHLTSHLIMSAGYGFSDDLAFTPNMQIVAVGDLDNDNTSEILVRMDEQRDSRSVQKLSVLVADDEISTLTELSSIPIEGDLLNLGDITRPYHERFFVRGERPGLTVDLRDIQKSGFASILNNGSFGGLAVINSRSRRGYYRFDTAGGLSLSARDIFPNYQQDLLKRTDEYIRITSNNRQTLSSLWHDLSAMMFLKNLEISTLNDKHYLVDEVQFGKFKDWDDDPETPPVKVAAELSASTRRINSTVEAAPWSSHYFWVKKSSEDRTIFTSFLKGYLSRRDVKAVIVKYKDGRLIEFDEEPAAGISSFTKRHGLAAGEELGLIVSVADSSAKFDVILLATE